VSLIFKNILAVGAHPDDIEYSCLGFLLKQKNSGADISTFVASLGSFNDKTSGANRRTESESALGLNGFKQYYSGTADFDYVKTETEIRDLVLKQNFDCVLVHDPRDSHQEHRVTYDITLSAIRRMNLGFILYRSVSTTNDFKCNYRVGVDGFFEQKLKTLKLHKSQQDKSYMTRDLIESFHTYYHLDLDSDTFYETFNISSLVD
jgi:LmbE family N-acetylglucosaminyl deacetylase